MSFLPITITVSFQHEWSSEFVKEYVSPINIMKGRVSPIIMNFNKLFNVMKGVYYQLLWILPNVKNQPSVTNFSHWDPLLSGSLLCCSSNRSRKQTFANCYQHSCSKSVGLSSFECSWAYSMISHKKIQVTVCTCKPFSHPFCAHSLCQGTNVSESPEYFFSLPSRVCSIDTPVVCFSLSDLS